MSYQFPNTPTLGQTFAPAGGPTYVWDGSAWRAIGPAAGPATVLVSDTPPPNPGSNQLWWESDTSKLYIWYSDADSSQWVQIFAGPTGATGPEGPAGPVGPVGPTPSIEPGLHETTLGVASTTISVLTNAIQTSGYALAGDGGGALYKRVVSEPAHAGKVQSMDGAWWELVPDQDGVNVKAFGAKGDFTGGYTVGTGTDDTLAFQNACNFAMGRGINVRLPGGEYRVTDTIMLSNANYVSSFGIDGANANSTRIWFDNAVSLKNLFHCDTRINYLQLSNFEVLDKNIRQSRAFYFMDTTADGYPAWKHMFQNMRITAFKEGVRFDGDLANYANDAHLDSVMFLHSKFLNNGTGLIYNNIQSVNQHLIATDFENSNVEDATEKWIHIKLERGTTISHQGGSVVGYGPYLSFTYPNIGGHFQFTSQFTSRNIRAEFRGDGPFIDHNTSSVITVSNVIRLKFEDMPIYNSGASGTPVLARFGGRVYARFDNVHANGNLDVQAYVTANLIGNGLFGFIEINDCKGVNYKRMNVPAYGSGAVAASNLQHIPAIISRKNEEGLLVNNGGFYEVSVAERTIYSGSYQCVTPRTLVYAKADTGGILSGDPATAQLQLPLYARPFKFRLLRDDISAANPLVFKLYAVVSAVDYEIASITPASGVGGHFEANLQTATGLAFYLRDDVNWDGKMKIIKTGATAAFVGLVMIDYM